MKEACVVALAFERAASMHLLAASAGTIQPINSGLGREAHEWILTHKRNSTAFSYYARRSLRNRASADCPA